MSEVEQVCHRIDQIRGGRLVRVGTLEELRGMRVHQISAVFKGTLLAADVGALAGVGDVRIEDHHLTCSVRGPVASLLRALVDAEVVEVDSRELSLEEVFISEYETAVSDADS
jgi:ABC-2 type transport system ATP-binding protein